MLMEQRVHTKQWRKSHIFTDYFFRKNSQLFILDAIVRDNKSLNYSMDNRKCTEGNQETNNYIQFIFFYFHQMSIYFICLIAIEVQTCCPLHLLLTASRTDGIPSITSGVAVEVDPEGML